MKLLVIAVEATSALGSSWPNLSNFVQNVVKSVCANGKARVEDNQIVDDVALSLVVFGAHGPNSPYLVYQTDWTNDFKCFFKWLSAVEFSSDVYHETVAIARGLAQVQLAYDHPPVLVEGLEKHCILVAFSNPEDQLPTAETVAESFLHNSISISLICPTPHPKLEAIYIAAKRNKSAIDQSICLEKIESGYTFLISDDLIEACPYLSSYSDLLANNPTNQKSLTDISPERVQSLAPLDDPFCLFPVLDGPPPLLDNQHFSDLISDKSFDHGSERVLSFAPFDDPLCLSPLLDARPPSLDDEHLYLVPDVPFDYDFETSDIVPSAVRCDESEQAQSSTVPQSARGDLVNPWDINLSTRHPCLAPTHRPSWLIDSSMIATMIRSASGSCNPEHINWKSNPTKLLKHAQTATISSATVINQAWPGLPRGLKFDPLDPEIIEHLLAKSGVNGFLPHPFIDDFIPTVKEADGICYTHPQKLPGVLQDGSVSHFFHKAFKMQSTGTKKRRKIHGDDLGGFRWHQTGRTRPVVLHGVQCGGKKIMVLNASSLKGVKEKTNWVMHLYHLGTEEDEKEGEYVISKVFYQQKIQSNPDGKDEDTGLKQGLTETYADPAQREIGPVSEAALETSSVDRNKNVSQGGDHMTEENHDSADLQGNNHSQGGEERRW